MSVQELYEAYWAADHTENVCQYTDGFTLNASLHFAELISNYMEGEP